MKRIWLSGLVVLVLVPFFTPARVHAQQTVRQAARTLLGGNFTEAEIDSVASVFAQQIATFPVGTSSGGFKFEINPKTFVATPRRDDFGPFFAERASTLGGGFTLAVNAQATTFETFEGRNLRNGDLRSRTIIGNRLVDIDRFTFNMRTQTTTLVATAAVDDHADVSVVVPLVRTSLNGTASSLDFATGVRVDRIVDASAAGFGDIVLRGKWNFYPGLAAAAEVFLPTGSTEQLAGTGHYRFKPMFVASTKVGTFSPHVNVGYTFGGRGTKVTTNGLLLPTVEYAEPGTEFNYTLGAEVAPKGPSTLFVDLIGRSMRSVARFDGGQAMIQEPGLPALPIETFIARSGTLNMQLGAIGGRALVLQKGLISAAILFPLSDGGLKAGLTPVLGFEWAF
jgi:hypothetical protein